MDNLADKAAARLLGHDDLLGPTCSSQTSPESLQYHKTSVLERSRRMQMVVLDQYPLTQDIGILPHNRCAFTYDCSTVLGRRKHRPW